MYTNYSILMSVYKNENPQFLKESIESMLAQTVVSDDFVIIKDGPLTNELNQILEIFMKKIDYIHIYDLVENQGLGRALRYGMLKCKNELIARMDSDDIAVPERCKLQIDEFNKNPRLELAGSFVEEFSVDSHKIEALKIMPCTNEEIFKYAKRRNPFNHSTVMFRKSSILKRGSYSELRRSQDFELFNRVVGEGIVCMNIAKPLVKYRRNQEADIRRKNWESVKGIIKIIYGSWKRGYSSNIDLAYVVISEISLMIMPVKMANVLYTAFFRKKY